MQQENSHFPFKETGVGRESASPHLFQTFQSLPGIFCPKVSDWTIYTNQKLERAQPPRSAPPLRRPCPQPGQRRCYGDWWAARGKAPDVRWGFNMAAVVAALAAAQER